MGAFAEMPSSTYLIAGLSPSSPANEHGSFASKPGIKHVHPAGVPLILGLAVEATVIYVRYPVNPPRGGPEHISFFLPPRRGHVFRWIKHRSSHSLKQCLRSFSVCHAFFVFRFHLNHFGLVRRGESASPPHCAVNPNTPQKKKSFLSISLSVLSIATRFMARLSAAHSIRAVVLY